MNAPKLRFKADDESEYPEWEEKNISESFPNIRNGFVGTITDHFADKENGVRYIEGVNIHDGIISDNVELYVTKEFHESHKKTELKASDILMVQSGHVGECAVVGTKYQGSNCHALIIMSGTEKAVPEFVVQYFHSPKGIKDLSVLIKGNTVKHILASDMNKYVMNFPCYQEQKKIANFFSALGDIINQTQAEVDAWEKQKQGMMQKLFSQEIRFKAEDGSEYPEWEEHALSDIAYYVTDRINVNCIVAENYVSTDNMLQNFEGITVAESIPPNGSVCKFQKGDILMSNIRPYLKKIWLADKEGGCSSDILVIRVKDGYNSLFIYEQLARNDFISYVMTAAKGSKMPRGDKAFTMNYTILQMSADEQRKIADCLSAFDMVIGKTKQELEAYKQLKKGLMQEMFV